MALRSAKGNQKGLATLEFAAWTTVILPLGLSFVALFGLISDQQSVRLIPESLMRETIGRSLSWESDGTNGVLRSDVDRLEGIVGALSLRAITKLQDESSHVMNASSRACYWVYGVDTITGDVGALIEQNCIAQGPLGNGLNIEGALNRRLQDAIARPVSGALGGFFPRVTLVGVSVGGRFEGLAELFREDTVEHAAVWVPREEVVL
jgi:hypothetical protein